MVTPVLSAKSICLPVTGFSPRSWALTAVPTHARRSAAVANNAFIAQAPFDGANKRYKIQFRLDAPTTVALLLTVPTTVGQSLAYCHSILASKQDYDAMRTHADANGQPLNLTWFDGDTYPR